MARLGLRSGSGRLRHSKRSTSKKVDAMANSETKEIVKAIRELTSELKRIRRSLVTWEDVSRPVSEVDDETDEG